ncbi:hypothetical protein FACS1894172_19320 [Spirochaetia bacterium]|nr:hypothetical protein FACS1894164_18710 [Spirochaetia bacterium]GHU36432.1 hypothetical protein FACS1894172_19320 [Spirochaetia bacterium]
MVCIKDILEYYSQCNKYININIIKTLKENNYIFNKSLTGYYKNINDILFHILTVDMSWTNDLKEITKSTVFEEKIYKEFNDENDINPYKSIIDFENDRIILDDLLIEYVNEINLNDLEKELILKNNKRKKVWEILIHTFNHQTHHRGQISQIIDENGIENDFSNMIRYDRNK